MNEGAESHWFSGSSQEPMGMKGMEVEGAGSHTHTHTHTKTLRLDYYYLRVKVGYCKFMGGGGYVCFRGVGG